MLFAQYVGANAGVSAISDVALGESADGAGDVVFANQIAVATVAVMVGAAWRVPETAVRRLRLSVVNWQNGWKANNGAGVG